jgi:transcriptional regulator with XRE-family HTH domain
MFEFDGFGQRLQNLRKKKNMTQGEFADRLGVTGQAVSKWENDQSYPDITLIPTIATIFDVEVNCLFGFKKQSFRNDIAFPEIYEDLVLVHHYQNIACYSLKEVDSIDGTGIKFKDGSTVELSSHLVVNVGQGEIRLLVSDDIDINIDLSKTSMNLEFDYVDSLDIEVLSNKCEIIRSSDNKCRVHANGESRFIDMLDIMVIEGKLIIRFDNKDGYNNNSYQTNNIKVELPCEIGKNVLVKVNGSGEFISEISKFEYGKLMINGSGSIRMNDFQSCSSAINGSGFIIAKNAESANSAINGSGEIKWEMVQTMDASINGSGDIYVKNVVSVNINVNGSGDVKIDNISGDGEANLRISGSGDIHLGSGSCKKIDINIKGNGDIDAAGVTVQKASIVIESNGQVILGRVIESSIEQIKKKGLIKILNRGKI